MTAWTDEQKARTVLVYTATGNLGEAQRSIATEDRTPSKDSIKRWTVAAGHSLDDIVGRATAKTEAACTAVRLGWEARKAEVILNLADLVETSIAKAQTYTDDDKPEKARSCMTAVGVGIEKLMLLHGEATGIVRVPWDPEQVVAEAKDRADALRPRLVSSDGQAV